MADLLAQLRDYTIHNREIREENDEIIFDNYAWPKSSKTNYIVWGSDKHGLTKEYYTLESIVYFLKNINLSHAQFVRQSAASGVLGIRLPDRQKLLDYLQGRITTCESIDHSVPVDISLRHLVTTNQADKDQSESSGEPLSKRFCLDDGGKPLGSFDATVTDQNDNELSLKENQRLAAKLDLPPGGKITQDLYQNDPSKASTLTEHIPVDKIQMLRAKFRANHQQTIKPDESEISDMSSKQPLKATVPSNNIDLDDQATVVKSFVSKIQLGATKTFVKEIMSREYTWRNRTTVLQSHGKQFFDSVVMGTLKSVKLKEENLQHHTNAGSVSGGPGGGGIGNGGVSGGSIGAGGGGSRIGPHTPFPVANGNAASNAQNAQSQAPTHYSRYDQERFTGAGQDTAGFKIDTMGTYHGKGLSSMMTDGSQGTMNSTNRDPRANRNQVPRGINPVSGAMATIDAGKGLTKAGRAKSRVPIIIIPAAPTSLITMYNAKEILQDLRFEKTEDKKSTGCRRDNDLLIQRQKPDGRTVPYRVIDQPNKLSREDWDRVVAVFVQGPAWQFKNWPIGNDPVEIFALVKAFHLKYTHMPLHPDVKKWNVHVIQLDDHRHLDKANFQQIWDILDRHMVKMKPHLRF